MKHDTREYKCNVIGQGTKHEEIDASRCIHVEIYIKDIRETLIIYNCTCNYILYLVKATPNLNVI